MQTSASTSANISSIQQLALESIATRESQMESDALRRQTAERDAALKLSQFASQQADTIFASIVPALQVAAKNPRRGDFGRVVVEAKIPIVEEEVGGAGCGDGGFMSARNQAILNACFDKLLKTEISGISLKISHNEKTKYGGNDDWPTQGDCKCYFLLAKLEFPESARLKN